jgi:putative transposase
MLTTPNQEWAIDFVMDSLATGRSFHALTIADSFSRECPAIEADSCLVSQRGTRVLDRMIEERGQPLAIRCDSGPEFTSRHYLGWCERRQIRLVFIEPSRPTQNGHIKSFNGPFRDECLNANWFLTLADAKAKIEV